MKVLFKSPEITATIISALRSKRDVAIKEMDKIKGFSTASENDKDSLIRDYQKQIVECNLALDEIGVD